MPNLDEWYSASGAAALLGVSLDDIAKCLGYKDWNHYWDEGGSSAHQEQLKPLCGPYRLTIYKMLKARNEYKTT